MRSDFIIKFQKGIHMNPLNKTAVFTALLTLTAYAQAEALTKEQALQKALEDNPSYKAFIAAIDAKEGSKLQASRLLNPDLYIEADNFYGENTLRDFQSAEVTFGFKQKFELSGKRDKRTDLANFDVQLANLKANDFAYQLLGLTEYTYMSVAIAKERLKLSEERFKLADKMHRIVEQRVSVAKASNIQHTQVDLILSAAQMEKAQAQREFTLSKQKLIQILGSSLSVLNIKDVSLNVLPKSFSENSILESLENTALFKMQKIRQEKASSAVKLEKAHAIPDPIAGLGIKRFNNNGTTALVASISMPFPIFDRNQGNIQKARSERLETEAEAINNQSMLTLKVKDLLSTFKLKQQEVKSYQQELLPKAKASYKEAYTAYKRGAFSFLNLLDIQRRLNNLNQDYLDSLLALYKTQSSLDRFSGRYATILSDFQANTEDK